ncbi:MAG: ABC transporter ATP-binding protein, partial [Caulobacteraceae bacterium]|nr:ABC transporter ATP-binding protein [Caulobacteraceae bacterium]
ARAYLAPFRWRLAFAVLASLVLGLSTAAMGYLLGPATNLLFGARQPAGALLYIPAAVMALALVRALATVAQTWTVNTIGHRIVGRIQVDLFGQVIRSDLSRLKASHSGAVVSSMLYDSTLVRAASTTAVVTYVREGVTVIGAVAVMLARDPVMTLAIMLAAPVVTGLIRRFTRWTKKATLNAMQETTTLSSAIMEGIAGVKVVKIDNREAFETDHVAAAVDRRQAFIIKGANIGAALAPLVEVVTFAVLAGVLAYAGWRHGQGKMTIGDFTSIAGCLAIASQSLRQLANIQGSFTEGFTAAQRMFAVMDAKAEVADALEARPLSAPARGVALDHVGFAYDADGDPAIEDISLRVERGETVALVGPSGGGKSTIFNLIPRFYDVTAGAVRLDGHDVRELTQASLRDQIALVAQEPFLFDDTVLANIAYPRPEATRAEVEAAARAAAAHDFITALPQGYDTLVGEGGGRLSGGQRQRVAIARAFLKNAPILLLDEATSALDTESEAQIQAALERLMAGRATILIAHRLSTVKNADRIYVIDKGRVVETGTHADLVREGGLYARLARAQDLDAVPPEAAE